MHNMYLKAELCIIYLRQLRRMQATLQTQQHIQQLRSGSNNILVSIRCRPLNQKQIMLSDFRTISILNQKMVVLTDPETEFKPEDNFRKNRSKDIQYAFDFAFDESASNQEVYSSTAAFLLDGVMDGYNATIFAYGATGCGKTYTMVGSHGNLGVMPRCLNDVFEKVEALKKSKDVKIKISYMEIYNENLKDLLISEDKNFEVREDPKQGVVVSGISEVPVTTLTQINSLLRVGNINRSKQSTGANQASSRSHAILQVNIESSFLQSSSKTVIKTSKLSLVDLAGSERASATSNRGQRMVEGAKINQSLLILGNCIQALSEANDKNSKNTFVPYRGSKLTRLLKDSLGGNCRTVMIANVSPSVSSFEDTYNTLVYANRAKTIKTNVHRNVLNVENHIANYTSIINNLKKENQDLRLQMVKGNKDQIVEVKTDEQQILIEKHQSILTKFTEEYSSLMKQISEIDMQIDNQGFYIFKLQMDESGNQIVKERVHNSKKLIETYSQKKHELEKQLKSRQIKLTNIIANIKQSTLNLANKNYLLGLVKQHEMSLEKQELIQSEKKLINENKQKQVIIVSLRNEITERDKVIQEQKILIQKNKIIHKIAYSSIKNHNHFEQQVKIPNKSTFPKIQKIQVKIKNPEKSKRKIFEEKLKSLDISALDTSIERADNHLKSIKESAKIRKSPQLIQSPKKYYFNKDIEREMKINQHRQKSVDSLDSYVYSMKKKRVDYQTEKVIPTANNRTPRAKTRKQKTQETQPNNRKYRQKQYYPNPLYMKRKKLKYEVGKCQSLNHINKII